MTLRLSAFFRGQYFQNARVFPKPTNIFLGTVLPKSIGSTVAGKINSGKWKRILEVLFPEKRRRESSAFWKYCSRKKHLRLSRASAPALAQFYLFLFLFFRVQYFHFVIFPQYGKSRKNPFCFYPTQAKQTFVLAVVKGAS